MSKVIRLTTYGDVFVEDKTLDEMRKSFDFANYRFCNPLGLSYLYEDGCPDIYEHNVWADLLLNDLCNMNDVYIFYTKYDEYDGLEDLTDEEIEEIIARVNSISTTVKFLRPLYDNLEDNIDEIRYIIKG